MTAAADLPPLFIPLKGEYFDQFDRGDKDTEWRYYGPRWNERTCPKGRRVVLSFGYGKHRRLNGIIEGFEKRADVETPAHVRHLLPGDMRRGRFYSAIKIKVQRG